MASTLYKASAPGNMMLLGEYAVLHGKHALVCAVDKRMTVILKPRPDMQVQITSALGHLLTDLSQITSTPPFQFITAILKKFRSKMPSGCDITIQSEFSAQLGLGSSAAVTVAMLAALAAWLKIKLSPADMIRTARAIIRAVQGLGSGADVAACVLGGVVAYKTQPLLAKRLQHPCPLTAVYAGYKTPTVEAVTAVKDFFAAQPKIFQQLCQSIDMCALQGIQAARTQDWVTLGKIMNVQQGLMESLGVNTPQLSGVVASLRNQSGIFGAKISGSGLGDCIIGLGSAADLKFTDEKVKLIPVSVAPQGVVCEKI